MAKVGNDVLNAVDGDRINPGKRLIQQIKAGLLARQRAISKRRRSPPEKSGGHLPALRVESELPEQPVDFALSLLAADIQILEDRGDILLDGKLAKDAVVLGKVAHAGAGPLVHGPVRHVLSA